MNSDARHRLKAQRGSMLLEVLLAVAVLTLGMAAVGIQINTAFDREIGASEAATEIRVMESVLAQLPAILQFHGVKACGERLMELEVEGTLGLAFPGYVYRIIMQAAATEGMDQVTVEIFKGPFDELDGSVDEEARERVFTLQTLRAQPARINADKLGMPQRDRDMLSANGLLDAEGNFCFEDVLAMDAIQLMEFLPQLMALGQMGQGGNAEQIAAMTPEQLLEMLTAQQQALSGGGGGAGAAGGNGGNAGGAGGAGGDGSGGGQGGQGAGGNGQPNWDEKNPNGGLTQEQYEWMLNELMKKSGKRGGGG